MAQVQLEYELYEHHLVAACLPPSATLLHVFEYCPLWSERWKKPSKPFSNCTYWQPELTKKQRALSRTNQLQGIFSGQHSLLNYTCPRRVDEFWNLFQPGANQDRTHARKNIVKIALRKLFVGILCGWCCWYWWWSEWRNHPNISIF